MMDCFSVLMEHEVTVYSLTTGTDAGGGVLNSFSVRDSGVRCLLNVQSGGDPDLFGQQQQINSVTVATFYTSAQRGDKLVVTGGPTLVGASLEITNIRTQPGLAVLGFEEITLLSCQRIA